MIPLPRGVRRCAAMLLTLLALTALAPPAQAGSFKLLSQNTLHLGWRGHDEKLPRLRQAFTGYDVILLQEVMRDAPVGAVVPTLGSYVFATTPLKGSSTYKEAYVFIIRREITYTPFDPPNLESDFSRPPAGVLLHLDKTSIWVVNYHAVYGKRKAERQREVRKMADIYTSFQSHLIGGRAHPRVILAGDWNLPGRDPAFADLRSKGMNMQVLPDAPTSLKTNGAPSQAYDHFVWDQNLVSLNNCRVVQATAVDPNCNGRCWRSRVSDHLGVTCDVSF